MNRQAQLLLLFLFLTGCKTATKPVNVTITNHPGLTASATVTPIRTPSATVTVILSPSPTPIPERTVSPWCPKTKNFHPNQIIKVSGYYAQTVLTKDGCPALLVLMPLKGDSPIATPTKNPGRGN